jgi:hypothetical protein
VQYGICPTDSGHDFLISGGIQGIFTGQFYNFTDYGFRFLQFVSQGHFHPPAGTTYFITGGGYNASRWSR